MMIRNGNRLTTISIIRVLAGLGIGHLAGLALGWARSIFSVDFGGVRWKETAGKLVAIGAPSALTDAIVNGVDADGDGRVGWQEGEGGLAQATQHLGLLKRGEGMGG